MNTQSVLSIAPLRVSFMGGGTDISSFYEKYDGCVVSTAINKYVYVHIKRHDVLFQERYRISYSEVEHTNERNTIQNSIVRGCLEFLSIDEPLQISISSDLPAKSGLGSSSSFTVALLNGLHKLYGRDVSRVQLAEEACDVEIKILNSPIGKQDQYAASFGGLNYFEFSNDYPIRIEPLNLSKSNEKLLCDNLLLIWTGLTREANTILKDQLKKAEVNFDQLIQLTELTKKFKHLLGKSTIAINELGSVIYEGWKIKQTLSKQITTNDVFKITDELDKIGCTSYKLLGAGGGGFILAAFDFKHYTELLRNLDWKTFPLAIDHQGARIVSIN